MKIKMMDTGGLIPHQRLKIKYGNIMRSDDFIT